MIPLLGEGGTQQRDRLHFVTTRSKIQGLKATNLESRESCFTNVKQRCDSVPLFDHPATVLASASSPRWARASSHTCSTANTINVRKMPATNRVVIGLL
jgi:hypothetical protein